MRRRPHQVSAHAATGRLPNFLIIGAPRAGTTSLASWLSEHPQIFIPPQKEVRFFDIHHERGLDWYRRQFAGEGDEAAVGDATPMYMFRDEALERMAKTLPDARLIAVLRDPLDRAYSEYWFRRAQGGEDRSFRHAIHVELTRPRERRRAYVERGRYLPRLQRVCEYYPRSSLCVVLLEDLVRDPAGIFGELCRFLGVDDEFPAPTFPAANPPYRVRSRWLLRKMLRHGAWQRLPLRLGYRLDALNKKPVRYPPLPEADRAELHAVFADHNAALADWLGRDLSLWRS